MINTGEVIPDTFPSNTVPTAQMWKKGWKSLFSLKENKNPLYERELCVDASSKCHLSRSVA